MLQKVKAVEKSNAPEKRDRQWSTHFLEVLVQELEEKERSKEGENKKQNEVSEYDRRIVIKGEQEIPEDYDSFEMTGDFTETILASEMYEDIISQVQLVGNWQANTLYKIAQSIMQDYYAKRLSLQAVGELFVGCYQKCVENNSQIRSSKKKKMEVLEALYEFFARVSARRSVTENEREGRQLVESCGLFWAGTTYYDSAYYYACEKVQSFFRKECKNIAKREQLGEISFDKIQKQTQFFRVGGLLFHSVFVWIQQKDNDPGNQYGMRKLDCIPPQDFIFLYRNHFYEKEERKIQLLQKNMKEKRKEEKYLWRCFALKGGREYHNGMSYLLEGSMMDEADDILYEDAMIFLQNFILYRVAGCVELLLVEESRC